MICPWVHNSCMASGCLMWMNKECAILGLARQFLIRTPIEEQHLVDPDGILNGCAEWVGTSSITALHRRDIDNYLAHSRTSLNYEQRRTLFRIWRSLRRVDREKEKTDPRLWRKRNANQGARWSDDEDAQLSKAFRSGATIESLAANHNRSSLAIECRLARLGLLAQGEEDKDLRK
jgi:hypothetical protein